MVEAAEIVIKQWAMLNQETKKKTKDGWWHVNRQQMKASMVMKCDGSGGLVYW